jgi:hypothetical protein
MGVSQGINPSYGGIAGQNRWVYPRCGCSLDPGTGPQERGDMRGFSADGFYPRCRFAHPRYASSS